MRGLDDRNIVLGLVYRAPRFPSMARRSRAGFSIEKLSLISHVQQLAFESATTGSGPSPFFVQSGREAEDGSNDDLRKGNPGAALVVIHGNCFSGGMAVIRAIVRLAKRSFSSYWINSAQALEG